MMTGPIIAIRRERTVDRRGSRLPTAWIRRGEVPEPAGGATFSRALTGARVGEGAPVALVMLTDRTSPSLPSLLAHAEAGARVYVLAPSDWRPRERVLLECRSMLVRRLHEIPFAAVFTEGEAALWVGAEAGGAAPWCLSLDDVQAQALRHLFLRLFWYESQDEGWSDGEQLQIRPPQARPFDVPEISRNAPLRPADASDGIARRLREDRLLLKNGPTPTEPLRRLWRPPGSEDHERLASLRPYGQIQWAALDLPDLRSNGQEGEIITPGRSSRWRLRLSSAQAREVATLLDGPTPWSFECGARLGELDTREDTPLEVWLPGAQRALPLTHQQPIALGALRASTLRALPDTEPASWPDPTPLALSACYRWETEPPRCPRGASSAPLNAQWQRLDAHWARRVNALQEALRATSERRGVLGRTFDRLKAGLLGFERSERGYSERLAVLGERPPSELGPNRSISLMRELSSLEAQIAEHTRDLDESERKAKEDEARASQQAEWSSKVKAAEGALPAKRAELERLEAERPALEEDLETIESTLKEEKDKAARKDLKARRHRVGDQIKALERQQARLTGEFKALEAEASAPFEFKPPAQPPRAKGSARGHFIPASKTREPDQIPEEALPEVGALMAHQQARYLVIDRWEVLSAGEEAAQRLHAQLVAPERP